MSDPDYRAKRNRQAAEWKARIKEFLDAYKLRLGCADCGYKEDAIALDFDHVKGEKSFALADRRRGLEAVMREIEKCEVVCANCHRIRTRDRRAA